MSDDFRQWLGMMECEFGTRFNKLFRGPGWSGCRRSDYNETIKVGMICCHNVSVGVHGCVIYDLCFQVISYFEFVINIVY